MIGRRIRDYRTRAGISVQELADMVTIDEKVIEEVENDKVVLPTIILADVANALKVSFSELTKEKEEEKYSFLNDNVVTMMRVILGCGNDDFKLFENCHYDICTILARCNQTYDDYDFYNIVEVIYESAIQELCMYVEIEQKKPTAKKEIMCLDPSEDFHLDNNYICSEIRIEKNAAIYRKYFQDALDRIVENSGLSIQED